MFLTPTQQTALRTYIQGNATLNAFPHMADGAYAIADALTTSIDENFIVWKTSVSKDEIMQNGFDWTMVDNLTVGKARIWEWMFANGSNSINAAKTNIRAGIDSCWVGNASFLAVRAAVYVHCKRVANQLEKVFATGTGTTADPATMIIEGRMNYVDVMNAMGWE